MRFMKSSKIQVSYERDTDNYVREKINMYVRQGTLLLMIYRWGWPLTMLALTFSKWFLIVLIIIMNKLVSLQYSVWNPNNKGAMC